MKRYFAGIILMLFAGMFSWAQGAQEDFDAKKIREEKEILRGILSTRLNYLSQKPGMSANNYFPNISSFYLPGEGMVFVFSIHKNLITTVSPFAGASSNSSSDLSRKLLSLNNELVARTRELMRAREQLSESNSSDKLFPLSNELVARAKESMRGRGQLSGNTSTQDLPKLQVLPATSSTPATTSAENISKLEKAIEELKEKIKATNQEMENGNAFNLTKLFDELRPLIVETIANYGDSLTTVKPDEHISFAINTESTMPNTRFVISARKSWVDDYKAGRLTLEAFKQKVIQYDN
jgi:hypothetical protein